jgi:WD40 repeat protein
MARAGDPPFDDSSETELRLTDDATLTSGPGGGQPGEPVTHVQESGSGTLPDLGLTTVPRDIYVVEGEIARGGMGRVLAAWDRRLGRPVALKELLSSSPERARRFEREALMTARLQHPSIVNVHEAGRWPSGEPFYAMKRVVGRPLDRVVKEARSLEDRLALLPKVLAVAEALAYAHEQGVIHRDLKPSNVLIGAFGETVVVDWGLAKDIVPVGAFDESEEKAAAGLAPDGLTVVGTVLGTPAYMAPEQARGERVDEQADVYALGAILYTVLAGRPPYAGPSSTAVLQEVLKGPPQPLEERQPGLQEDLLALVRKAMAAQREDRYRTAREFAEDLRRFQTGQLVGAHRYSTGQILRRWIAKHRGALGVGMVAALALAVLATLAIRRIQTERDAAQARNDELILAQARANLETDPTSAVAWLKHYSLNGPKWGAVRMIAADARSRGIARRRLPGHEAKVADLAFSPDGRQLASVGIDYALRLWDVETGSGSLLFRSDWHAKSVAFSPDGQRIAFGHGTGRRVGLWDLRAGKLEGSTEGASNAERVWFTSDGRDLLMLDSLGSVDRWDIVKRAYRFKALERRASWPRWTPEMVLSADRKRAATRNERDEIESWDLDTGERTLVAAAEPGQEPAWEALAGGLAYWGEDLAFGRGEEVRVVRPNGTGLGVLGRHEGAIRTLASSPDGGWLASGGEDWTVRLWARDGSPARVFRGHTAALEFLAFSPDGRTLASQAGGADGRVLLWDVATGRKRVLSGETQRRLTFSPDGATLATSNRSIRLWSVASADTDALPAADAVSDNGRVAFSPSGRWLATGAHDRPLRLWRLEDGTSQILVAWKDRLNALAFSSDERTLAAAGGEGIVHVWSLPDLAHRELRGHAGRVDSLAFTPDSSELASTSADKTIRLWSVVTGKSRVLEGHESWVLQVTYSPDGKRLASASAAQKSDSGVKPDKDVHLWERATGAVRLLKGHTDTVVWVAFSPDGRFLASGSMDHTVRIWDVAKGTSTSLVGHGDVIFQVAFSPRGDALVSTSDDGTTRVWDLATGASRLYSGYEPAFSTDGRTLSLHDRILDLPSGEARRLTPDDWVGPLVFSPRGGLIAARTASGGLRLWRDDLPSDPRPLRAWLDQATNYTVDVTGVAE